MNAPIPASHLAPEIKPRHIPAEFIDELKTRFGDQCSTALAVREQHGRDESAFVSIPPPSVVVFAKNTLDISDAVRIAERFSVPIIPFGVGSSLEGHLLAVQGGMSLDVSQMNKILSINAEDLTVTVQPGTTRMQLNNELKSTGLFFPIDPGADASIGGMCATRASGTNAVRYGTMRENVLALEVVNAKGEIIKTGTRAKKSSAGYDLTRLFVGSEGTLGVISEITLKIYPLPEAISAAICSFPSIESAVLTTIQIIQMGIPIARVEHGGEDFEWASTPEERTRLWSARHNAYFAAIQSRPGCRAISTDTCVPISRLADCLLKSVEETEASSIPFFLVGHVGDGNFHFGYLIDPNNPSERETAEQLNDKLVARALSMGGTCSGEHGIGLHKMGFLIDEAGEAAVDMMRTIKVALDPKNIMNPGKIFSFTTK